MKTDSAKRILGLAGSPRRKGNTHLLVSEILAGAREAGALTELVFLADLNIRECTGCHACWRGKPCPRHDDMNRLYPKLEASDAFVFGTPVYWYGPTALMKAFLDRWVYFNCPANRASIRGKAAVLAVPYEETTPATADLVVAMFARSLRYLEMRLAGQVLAPGLGGKGAILGKPHYLLAGRELGRRLAHAAAGAPACVPGWDGLKKRP